VNVKGTSLWFERIKDYEVKEVKEIYEIVSSYGEKIFAAAKVGKFGASKATSRSSKKEEEVAVWPREFSTRQISNPPKVLPKIPVQPKFWWRHPG
ncbi:MAG TPA: hypothetical protein VGN16_22610, partial [Acidobacteriaceae bacterium]|jgi:hypothetical protein